MGKRERKQGSGGEKRGRESGRENSKGGERMPPPQKRRERRGVDREKWGKWEGDQREGEREQKEYRVSIVASSSNFFLID